MNKPENNDISSSVVIDLSTWFSGKEGLRGVGKKDGSCIIGTRYEAIAKEWQKTGAKVCFYNYFMGVYGSKQKWMPMADEMQEICKFFKEKGILGLGTQMETFNMWNNIFNFYSYGRTAYDCELTLEDNLNSFCRIFGNASKIVKEIILYGESIIDGQGELSFAGEYLMKNIDREKVYSMYEEALKTAETSFFRNNVRMMRMVFRYSDLETNNSRLDVKAGVETNASDENGELWYMAENFDSFISKKEGYGIATPAFKRNEVKFSPDYWYKLEE